MDASFSNTSLSNTLRDARVAKGLELSDIAEITHVRKEYLQALEEGRYGDLPEDIYARNFLRLYAQAVGLDDAKLLERFARERRAALGISTVSEAVANGYRDVTPRRRNPAAVWLPVLVLLGAVGGIGYFVFNTYFRNGANPFQSRPVTTAITESEGETESGETETNAVTGASESTTATTPETDAAPTSETNAATTAAEPTTAPTEAAPSDVTTETTAESNTPPTETAVATTTPTPSVPEGATTTPTDLTNSVRFSLVTNPPGAEATLDNYPFPARTPFFNAPVTPRTARVLRITLEGYQPHEELLDIEADTSKAINLVPVGTTEAAVLGETPAETTTPAQGQATGQGQLGITIEAETWLEIYQSTVRGEGERLVYTTVQPGTTYSFNLPVYVHVGNGAGVRLSQNGQDAGLMGSSGEVTGRAFGQPLPPAPEPTPAPTPAEPTPTDPAVEGPQ